MRLNILFISLVLILSCNNKNNLKHDLIQLQSREIKLSLNNMKHLFNGKDSLILDFDRSEMKLVVYSNSSACSSCAIDRMYNWDRFIENTQKYQGLLKFYFLFSPRKEEVKTVKIDLRRNIFDYPIFIDSAGVFAKENPHLPKNSQLHTFLLDENNKVILVGNPLNNPKIEEMFYKIVEEKLGKK